MPPQTASPARPRRLRAALAVALGLLLAFGALEVAARVLLRVRGEAWSSAEAREDVEAARASLFPRDWQRDPRGRYGEHAAMTLHPFAGFMSEPSQRFATELAKRSSRSAENGVFELGIVGGSVSCVLVHESGKRLSERLEADPRFAGRKVRVHMLGQGGWKQPQQLMLVNFLFSLGARFDAIVNVDGFNEVAIGQQNRGFGAHPLYPSFPHWSHLLVGRANTPELQQRFVDMIALRETLARRADRVLSCGVLHSAALGALARRSVRRGLVRFQAMQKAYSRAVEQVDKSNVTLQGPPLEDGAEATVEASVRGWYESSLSLAAACERRGVRYLHVLQPTLHDAGSKTWTAEERATSEADLSWIEGVVRGYPRLRVAGQELAAKNVEFFDASRIFADDHRTLYYDACHFGREGCDVLADAIADALLSKMQ